MIVKGCINFKKAAAILLSLIIAVGVFFPLISASAKTMGNIYYVSISDGDDSNQGTVSSPFKTIQKASDVMQPGDTCIIREGIYPEEVIPASGSAEAPVTYTAYPGETVTISGCDPITGWTQVEGEENMYKASFTMVLGAQNQIFDNGEITYLARYPNIQPEDTLTNFTPGYTGAGTTAINENGETRDTTYIKLPQELMSIAGNNPDFFNGTTLWTIPGSKWTALTLSPSDGGYDPETGLIKMPSCHRTIDSSYYTPAANNKFYIQGAKGLLDQAGEWWYDEEAQEVYIIVDGDPNEHYIEAKSRLNAFDMSGVSYVDIDGIDARGSTIITDEDSSYINLKNMSCTYVSHHNELKIERDAPGEQDDLGILLKGSNINVISCEFAYSSGPVVNVQGIGNSVINSYIHDGDYIGGYCGHVKLTGRQHLISHNTFQESGRDVISFRQLSESVVQYNEISDAGRLAQDLGMMYTANSDGQNTLIHHNVLHDNYSPSNSHGLYPDEMSSNYIIYQNIIYAVPGKALLLNQPSLYMLAYNNSTYNNSTYGGNYTYSSGITGYDTVGRQVLNNITYNTAASDFSSNAGTTFIGNNLTTNMGADDSNVYADLGNGNFSLAENSPAIGAGVQISGVTDASLESPSMGALEYNESMFDYGHDFSRSDSYIAEIYNNVPSAEQFEYRNLLRNGGFEFGNTEYWEGSGSVVEGNGWHLATDVVRAGFYGAELAKGQYFCQTMSSLSPDTAYEFALNIRRLTSSSEASVQISIFNGKGEEILSQVLSGSDLNAQWGANSKRVYAFVTGSGEYETVTIEVRNVSETDELVYFDDAGFAKIMANYNIEFALQSQSGETLDPANAEILMSYTAGYPKTLVKVGEDGTIPFFPPNASTAWDVTIQYQDAVPAAFTHNIIKATESTYKITAEIDYTRFYMVQFLPSISENVKLLVMDEEEKVMEPNADNDFVYMLQNAQYSYIASCTGYEDVNGDFVVTGGDIEAITIEFIKSVDKSELLLLFEEHKDKEQGDYTDETWMEFVEALAKTNEVLENDEATQEEVETAKELLNNAVEKLEAKEPEIIEVESVKILNGSLITISKGNTAQLEILINPDDAADKSITYQSSNTNIAAVSETGEVTGVAKGLITITVTAHNGVKATVLIRVS